MDTQKLLEDLSSFDGKTRVSILRSIADMVKRGKIKKSSSPSPWINLHIHTFHSFNYKNWSPSRVVFEGWEKGLLYAGTVDFDSLAGLEETLEAGRALGIKVTGGFESRVLIDEMKDNVINSPNEPGIYYLCGKGFKEAPRKNTPEEQLFANLKETAQERNRKVIKKLNGYLQEIQIDFEKEVLPLTPSSNPTERHIIEAYKRKGEETLGKKSSAFWAGITRKPEDIISRMVEEKKAEFLELLRKTLIKEGGRGYIPPEKKDFPRIEEVIEVTEKAGGIPTGTWLDGTNEGEKDPEQFVRFMEKKGIKAMTIIPERNYNIKDKAERDDKVKKLRDFMETCIKEGMPVVCGTEMNKYGQPFVDNFKNTPIEKYLGYFLESADCFC